MLGLIALWNGNLAKASNAFRLCFSRYLSLESKVKDKKRINLVLPNSVLQDFKGRVCFGIGLFKLFSSVIPSKFQWILPVQVASHNSSDGISNLQVCCTHNTMRSNWAGLALMNSGIPIRMSSPSTFDAVSVSTMIASYTSQSMANNPQWLFYLWSRSYALRLSELKESLDFALKAEKACPSLERAHFLRFHVGRILFLNHHWQPAASHFEKIVKYASTAPKSTLYEAYVYLAGCLSRLTLQNDENDPQAYVKIRRYLRLALDIWTNMSIFNSSEDGEVHAEMPLMLQRAVHYVNAPDRCLQLIPFDLLYIFDSCYSPGPTKGNIDTMHSINFDEVKQLEMRDEYDADRLALSTLNSIGTNANLPSLLQQVINAIVENDPSSDRKIKDVMSLIKEKANASVDQATHSSEHLKKVETDDFVFLAEWLTIRGAVLLHGKDDSGSQTAMSVLSCVDRLEEIVPRSVHTYAFPVSYYLMARELVYMNVESGIGKAIHLLERALVCQSERSSKKSKSSPELTIERRVRVFLSILHSLLQKQNKEVHYIK